MDGEGDGEGEMDVPVPGEREAQHVSAWVQEFSNIIELQLGLLHRIAASGLCGDEVSSCNLGTEIPGALLRAQPQQVPRKSEPGKADLPDLLPTSNLSFSHKGSMGSQPSMAAISEEKVTMERLESDVFGSSASEQLRTLRRSLDESFKKEQVQIFVEGLLNPDWIGKLTWDFLVMFLVLMDAMILPFQLTFKENATGSDEFDVAWLWITTVVFASDIIATFNTACIAPQLPPGTFETSRCQIAKQYLRGWFTIDFGSTIPWAQISEAIFANASSSSLTRLTRVVKLIRLLRLMRMLRLAKLAVIWDKIEAKIGSIFLIQCISLLRVLGVVVAMCHWSACLFWLVGLPTNLFTELMSDEAQAQYLLGPHWTTVWRRHDVDSMPWRWLDRSMSETYIFCFYWTLGVMRTMPAEVTPVNLPERVFVLIFMFFALSAFAICISMITQAFFKISERRRAFHEEFAAVRLHLRSSKVNEQVQERVKTYLKYLFNRRRIQAKEANLMNQLPQDIKMQVVQCQVLQQVDKLPAVNNLRRSIRLKVCEIAHTCDIMAWETVVQEGQPAEAAWVLVAGRVQRAVLDVLDEASPATQAYMYPKVVDAETLDSEEVAVSHSTVMALETTEMIKIDKVRFFEILKEHSSDPSQKLGGQHGQKRQLSRASVCMTLSEVDHDRNDQRVAAAAVISAA